MDTVAGGGLPPKTVRLGAGQARIISVTPGQLSYCDENGSTHDLDLHQCAAQWSRWREEHAAEFFGALGQWLAIPSISADPARRDDVARSAAWLSALPSPRCSGRKG